MRNILFLSIILALFSSVSSFSQCLDCQDYSPELQITYSVNQLNCGTCTYTVFYKECQTQPGKFLISKIEASPSNLPCCQGTAVNNPIVSGMILDEAANQIANEATVTIYTPSRCWQWIGTVGPDGIHHAVMEPCGSAISCCIYTYENGVLISLQAIGEVGCYNEGCMPLCVD